ncbi:MAG: transcription termination factor NusA [Oscillospiraceae bacterium]|nr:transcription termination factor NusA [Oscillospiraceae bacterium]
MKKVDYKELIAAMDELEKEKGIEKAYLIEALETALITAYKKSIDSDVNVKVSIEEETGEMHLFIIKTVVKEVEKPDFEISLEDAKKIKKKYKLGEEVYIEIIPEEFGRIAAQTAKQIVIQKIKEAERNLVFSEYNDKKGSIVTGIIQKIDNSAVVIDLGRLEGIMPTKEQMQTEEYTVNQKIKVYVVSVERGYKGIPQAIVSRKHPDFVKKLLEFEIPEIYEGIIEIKSVARDAGSRSKVAVYSANPNIDPVGSCVGQKGIRIQNIIKELKGEKIDVIEWNEDPAVFIAAALLPAQVLAVDIKEEKVSQVIVPDDQLSLAIGKFAQNVRLAAKLTGWKIDLKSETEFRKILMERKSETRYRNQKSETKCLK